MEIAAVPVVAIAEDDDAGGTEHNVRTTDKIARANTVAQSGRLERPAKNQLAACISLLASGACDQRGTRARRMETAKSC